MLRLDRTASLHAQASAPTEVPALLAVLLLGLLAKLAKLRRIVENMREALFFPFGRRLGPGCGFTALGSGAGVSTAVCAEAVAQLVKRLSILTPDRRAKLTPLSGTAEVVPVANRGDPRGFV